jgi:CubicO group peptidase (beta-lactamase class C family)
MLRPPGFSDLTPLKAASPTAAGHSKSARACAENGLIPADADSDSPKFSIEDRMRFYSVPGVSLAVINDSKIEWAKGYGVLQTDRPEPVTPETRFQAASISKPVSAMGSLALVEQRKLSLDAPVNDDLRSWKLPENHLTRETPVTLRMLLSHTAGINVQGFAGYPAWAPIPSLDQILDGLPPSNSPKIRVEDPPGVSVKYSGGGMLVMQKLVEDTVDEKFTDYMREAVLRPLGMIHSTFQIMQPTPGFATAHQSNGRPVVGRWHRHPESTAAGLWTTAADLARFIIELQESRVGKSNRVLSQTIVETMLASQMETAGLGVFIGGNGLARRFTHSGANVGFRSLFIGFTEKGKGLAVLANSNSGDSLIAEITRSVAMAYGWPSDL